MLIWRTSVSGSAGRNPAADGDNGELNLHPLRKETEEIPSSFKNNILTSQERSVGTTFSLPSERDRITARLSGNRSWTEPVPVLVCDLLNPTVNKTDT